MRYAIIFAAGYLFGGFHYDGRTLTGHLLNVIGYKISKVDVRPEQS